MRVLALLCTLAACQPARDALAVAARGPLRPAFEGAVAAAFAQTWLARTGRRVEIELVERVEDADVAAPATMEELERLEKAGLLGPAWRGRAPPAWTVVALLVPTGNPRKVRDLFDVAGARVVLAEPAEWALAGLWAAPRRSRGATGVAATDALVRSLRAAGPDRPPLARLSRGEADAILGLESELLAAGGAGLVVPRATLRVEGPVAVVDAVVDRRGTRELAAALMDFLYAPDGQAAFARDGLRPVDPAGAGPAAARFARVGDLYTIEELGGRDKVRAALAGTGPATAEARR